MLRDFVDACIAHRRDPDVLTRKLGLLLHSENLARSIRGEHPLSGWPIADVFHSPRAFISYAHEDKAAVMSLYAPQSAVTIGGNGSFYGAIVGGSVNMSGTSSIHYDLSLAAASGVTSVQ